MKATFGVFTTIINARGLQYVVLGGFGGLTGWYVLALVFGGEATAQNSWLWGGVLGSFIGLGVGLYEGIAFGSWVRAVRFGGPSLILGLIGGAVGLFGAQLLYGNMHGGHFWAMLCWLLFGSVIGLGEGFSKGSQTWKGLLGGACGGVIGGGFYEVFGRPQNTASPEAEQFILAFALLFLGASIGASIALVTSVLRNACLVVENGKLAGREIDVSKYVDPIMGTQKAGIIGSSQWDTSVTLLGDSGVLPHHASISYKNGAPTLTVLDQARRPDVVSTVNNHNVTEWPLRNGDRLQFGSTNLIFRAKR